jgi:hypothetical protein
MKLRASPATCCNVLTCLPSTPFVPISYRFPPRLTVHPPCFGCCGGHTYQLAVQVSTVDPRTTGNVLTVSVVSRGLFPYCGLRLHSCLSSSLIYKQTRRPYHQSKNTLLCSCSLRLLLLAQDTKNASAVCVRRNFPRLYHPPSLLTNPILLAADTYCFQALFNLA